MSRPTGTIIIDVKRCKGCGLCIDACPKKHIRLAEQEDSRGVRVACFKDRDECTGCGFCYIVCPDVAVTVFKTR